MFLLLVALAAALPLGLGATPRAVATSASAPSLVRSAGATETAGARQLTATFPTATGAGHLLVLAASVYTGTTNPITSVTDQAGNTWTRIGRYAVSGHNSAGEMWFAANARPTATVTVHTGSAAVIALDVEEYQGVAATGPLDGSHGAAGSGTTAASGGATGTQVGDLAVGFVAGHGNAQAITVTSGGLTAQPQRTSRAGSTASVVAAAGVASGTGTPGITASWAKSMYWAAGVALFKPATSDFSLTTTPAAATSGFPATATVGSTVTSGTAQPVALSVSGLPDGTTASFAPATITAGQSSTLTVHTSVSTPPGPVTLTVTGAGTSATETGTLTLTVSAPRSIRAAFYYPWFPQAWVQQGQNPFTNYDPTAGYYSSGDLATVSAQVADMQYGGITLGLASWWGQGSTSDTNMPTLMQAAAGTGFQWAPYYEPEGTSDPTPQQIADDLHYLWTTYHTGPDSPLASVPGKGMVVFVYNTDDPTTAKGCDTVDRWNQARQLLQSEYGQSAYIDLKVFPGYRTCAGTPTIDGWHQYGPASAVQDFSTAPGDGSYAISPGYWKSGATYGTAPFLARDRARWQSDIASMIASGAKWQLVTTYNEWGEGTAVESSSGCHNPAPAGTYCDWSGGGTRSDFITDLHANPPS
jgi:hypothetical protein